MALKETNKSRKTEEECCGQGCNNHENKGCGITHVPVDNTCKLDNQIVFGTILILGSVFLLLNVFVFPNL